MSVSTEASNSAGTIHPRRDSRTLLRTFTPAFLGQRTIIVVIRIQRLTKRHRIDHPPIHTPDHVSDTPAPPPRRNVYPRAAPAPNNSHTPPGRSYRPTNTQGAQFTHRIHQRRTISPGKLTVSPSASDNASTTRSFCHTRHRRTIDRVRTYRLSEYPTTRDMSSPQFTDRYRDTKFFSQDSEVENVTGSLESIRR
ncbi:hypothetical protein ABH922_005164 [Rhodococcus sp. 27YEA15]